ncbi:MAG: hypothetical protein OXC66_15000 [Roseovarius sp.]|nr:hypothetical protein [Roseovarius sp.]
MRPCGDGAAQGRKETREKLEAEFKKKLKTEASRLDRMVTRTLPVISTSMPARGDMGLTLNLPVVPARV